MSTLSASELAARAGRHQVRCDRKLALRFLEEWEALEIAEEPLPGRWRLTERGRAMFGGWVGVADLGEPASEPPRVLGKQDAAKFGERGGRGAVLEGAEDREALVDLQGEDSGSAPVGRLEPVGEPGVVDQAGELEDVGAGDGDAGDEHVGHGALHSSRIGATGSAVDQSDEPTAEAA